MKLAAFEVQFFARIPHTPFSSTEASEVFCCFWHHIGSKSNDYPAYGFTPDLDLQENLGIISF